MSTEFDVPSTTEAGASTLVVVANGIPSNPVNVTIEPILCGQTVSCTRTQGFTVDASITLSCNERSSIAVSAQACIFAQGCGGQSSNSGFLSTISTSANAYGPHAGEGYSCNFTYTYNGTEYSESCQENICQ